jgi:aspartyl-tRNA synthetase
LLTGQQFDMELPFHDGVAIRARIERLISELWQDARALPHHGFTQEGPELPIKCISYNKAMSSYGSDKPDLRIPGWVIHLDDQ